LERRHQPIPGLHELRPRQPTAGQTCPRKVPAVTTSALPHNATKIQGSCPQRSGEALELFQGRLEALLPSHRWIRQEIATSGHTRYWEGIPGFLRELTFCGNTMYPAWASEALCAMLRQRLWDPLSLLYPSPSGECLWQSHLVPTLSTTTKKACAMGGSFQPQRLLALQLQVLEHHQQTYWQVWTLLSPVPRLDKFHHFAIGKEWGCTRLATASPPGSSTRSCPTYRRFQHLGVTVSPNLSGQKSLLLPSDAWSQENLRDQTHLPGVYTPRQVSSQTLVPRLPQFLHAPTQNSKDLE